MTLDSLFEAYEKKSPETRAAEAKEAAKGLRESLLGKGYGEKEVTTIEFHIARVFAASDREIDEAEANLFNEIFDQDLTFAEFTEMAKDGNKDAYVSQMNVLVDTLDKEDAERVCLIGMAFLAADGKIEKSEKELFGLLLAR